MLPMWQEVVAKLLNPGDAVDVKELLMAKMKTKTKFSEFEGRGALLAESAPSAGELKKGRGRNLK